MTPQPTQPDITPAMEDSAASAGRGRMPVPSRLRGVRFKGPIRKITTVDSPLKPPGRP